MIKRFTVYIISFVQILFFHSTYLPDYHTQADHVLPLPNASRTPSSPTHLLPTSFPYAVHTHFDLAEMAILRVLGLDPDLLIDAVEEGLRADLFEQIACSAAPLSQVPRHERTGALLDIWLFKVVQQVKDETTMRRIQDQGIGDLTLGDKGIADGLAQLLGSGSRYRLEGDGQEELVGMLPNELAGEYGDAMALVDIGRMPLSLS